MIQNLTSVSVVIPVLNAEEHIKDLLVALQNQAHTPENTEIIVVDNGSNDRTRDIGRDFDVVLLKETKRGPGPARNMGLDYASGEIIAHLDADTIPTRRWLAELTAPFSDPSVMITAGKTLIFQPETPAQKFFAGHNLYDAEVVAERDFVPYAPSLNIAVRRQAAVEVGGWAEDMPTAEDMDFCYRILQRFPTDIIYQPSAVLFHKIPPDMDSLRRKAWVYGEGSAHFVLKNLGKNYFGPIDYWLFLKGLTYYSLLPFFASLKRMLSLCSSDEEQYAYSLREWNLFYWRGFFSMYRTGIRKTE
jgi:glycosyltransferase involved in cell wall biosynthesis